MLKPAAIAGIEVRDLDLDPQLRPSSSGCAHAESRWRTSSARNPQPRPARATSSPSRIRHSDLAVVALEHVLGRLEAQQRQRAGEQDHDARSSAAVDDADQAERHARQEAPVGARRGSRGSSGSRAARGRLGRRSARPTAPTRTAPSCAITVDWRGDTITARAGRPRRRVRRADDQRHDPSQRRRAATVTAGDSARFRAARAG